MVFVLDVVGLSSPDRLFGEVMLSPVHELTVTRPIFGIPVVPLRLLKWHSKSSWDAVLIADYLSAAGCSTAGLNVWNA